MERVSAKTLCECLPKYAEFTVHSDRYTKAIVCKYMRTVARLHRRGEVSRDDAVNAIYRVKVLNNLA